MYCIGQRENRAVGSMPALSPLPRRPRLHGFGPILPEEEGGGGGAAKKKTCGKRSRRGESEGAEEIDGQPYHAATDDDNDEDRQKDMVTEGEGVDNDDLQLANQFGSVMDIASHCDKRDGVANWEHSAGVMLHDTGTYTPFPVLPQPLVPWT